MSSFGKDPRSLEIGGLLAIVALAIAAVLASTALIRATFANVRPQIALVDELPRLPGAIVTIDSIDIDGKPSRDRTLSRRVARRAVIDVSGWGLDGQEHTAGIGMVVYIDGVPEAIPYGASRPDVAAGFGVPAYQDSGFRWHLLARRLAPGHHVLQYGVIANSAALVRMSQTSDLLVDP